ncbi:hypothetical protein M0L20_14830 [Spirosoma sp. RP8]|uniref:Uncharacterized protein n=1 Tax=Spirosoma liriopis TaxID=2937440 RepID=A0ABT0HLT8_9BACT|nr:hypothetical protein [Spirosoma liriopis]MCK8493142.1 hypothetical protein [Spirosoma liriopis]
MDIVIMIEKPYVRNGKLKWHQPDPMSISDFGFVPRVGDRIILHTFVHFSPAVEKFLDTSHSVVVNEVEIYWSRDKKRMGAVIWTKRPHVL